MTKPSGAPGSTLMERLRSPAECPGLGARTLLPLASPPSALAKLCGSITLMDESSVRSAAAKTSDQGWLLETTANRTERRNTRWSDESCLRQGMEKRPTTCRP